jgi:hydrogenase maturation protease
VSVLVIGYGNELRGDDALGPLAARAVAGWGLPGVRCLDLHQLTPELVEEMVSVERAIFIDARLGGEDVRMEELSAGGAAPAGHVGDPRGLLALCGVLHGRAPRAWLVTVRAEALAFGAGLSAGVETRLWQALALLRRWLDDEVA